jgi:cob(I)alamin adenosyltransferase
MIDIRLIGIAVNFGKDLGDESARVNWKKLEEIDKKVTEEIAEKLAKLFADLRVERRRQSYDTDTLRARGVEGLRAILSECSAEPELTNSMVKYMELAFLSRLEEARVGRRKAESLLRKTQLVGDARTRRTA